MFTLFPQIALQKCYVLTTLTACSSYLGFKLFWILPATWHESHTAAVSFAVHYKRFSFFWTVSLSLRIFMFRCGCFSFYAVFHELMRKQHCLPVARLFSIVSRGSSSFGISSVFLSVMSASTCGGLGSSKRGLHWVGLRAPPGFYWVLSKFRTRQNSMNK